MYRVRKARLEDLKVLKEFEQGLIEAERPMDPTIKEGNISYYKLETFIRSEDATLMVVEHEGKILASGHAMIKKDRPYLKHDRVGFLGFMFVSEEHRGKGLNKSIIDSLLEWCREKELEEVRLTVYSSNAPAIKAYEKAGFHSHMITMRKNLNAPEE